MIHFLPRKLRTRSEFYHSYGKDYERQSYHELVTACGNRITAGGYSRRGWTFTSTAEDVTCGRCKMTQEWRAEIRRLVREGVIEELPRYIP